MTLVAFAFYFGLFTCVGFRKLLVEACMMQCEPTKANDSKATPYQDGSCLPCSLKKARGLSADLLPSRCRVTAGTRCTTVQHIGPSGVESSLENRAFLSVICCVHLPAFIVMTTTLVPIGSENRAVTLSSYLGTLPIQQQNSSQHEPVCRSRML